MLMRLLIDERVSRSIDVLFENKIIIEDIIEFVIMKVNLSKTSINKA